MRRYNRFDYLFSIHIPKCAGTSFIQVLRQWFWPGFHAHYFDHEHGKMPRSPMFAKQICHHISLFPLVIHGHFEEECSLSTTYPKAKQFITVIRDPLDMQLSLFFDHQRRLKEQGALYWKGENLEMEYGGDLDTWVAERPSYLLKFFPWKMTIENYKDIINEHFIHIGTTEQLQASIHHFSKKLGKRPCKIPHINQSRRDRQPSSSAIQAFKEKHSLEYAIYHYVCSLNQNQKDW